MSTATITSKGQVTIPKEVRDALNLQAGHRVDFELQKDGNVLVRPRTVDFMKLRGIVKSKRRTPVSLEEMDLAIAKGASDL
jgi:AbrB family looped-hinge helix DNA binding protein